MFFLQYSGKGFTDAGIWAMPMDQFIWSVHRLNKQLADEHREREKQAAASRSRVR